MMKSARSANSQQPAQSQPVQQPQSLQARRRSLRRVALAAVLFLCLFSLGYCVLCAGTLCPTSGLLGIPCPLCGMSRALMLALDGSFTDALDANPAFPAALVAVLLSVIIFLRDLDERPYIRPLPYLLALCVAAVLAIYTLRMLALFPDHPIMCLNERALIFLMWGNA